jgi:YjgF/chorismate_mutase-like, putative endoribonuclease
MGAMPNGDRVDPLFAFDSLPALAKAGPVSDVAERLAARGIELPGYPEREGSYARFRRCGSTGYVAAHGPVADGRVVVRGRVGGELDVAAGREAAHLTMLAILSTLRHHLGDLDRVRAVARVGVMVQAAPDFHEHHLVADAASETLLEAFGAERGAHARMAVGLASLPLDMAVNIDAVVEVD